MITATNQRGHTIERFDGPAVGWIGILGEPFTSRAAAVAYLDGMPRTPGAEYRVYAALPHNQAPPRCVACGQLQGEPNLAGCPYAKLTIRKEAA